MTTTRACSRLARLVLPTGPMGCVSPSGLSGPQRPRSSRRAPPPQPSSLLIRPPNSVLPLPPTSMPTRSPSRVLPLPPTSMLTRSHSSSSVLPSPPEQHAYALAQQRAPTHVQQRAPTPVQQRAPTPVQQRAPTPRPGGYRRFSSPGSLERVASWTNR